MISSLKMKAIVTILGVAGVGGAAFATGVVQVPEAGLADKGDWGQVNNDSINIISTGYVNNPNSFGVNLSSLDVKYRLKMNDVMLAEGGKSGLEIEKDANQTVSVDTRLKPEKVPDWWATHLRNNEKSKLSVPLNVELKLFSFPIKLNGYSYTDTIETDLESKMDRAVSRLNGNYSWSLTDAEFTETEIGVRGGSAEFGKVTSETTELIVNLRVYNPNSYPIPTPQFSGSLDMNEVAVAEWQANDVKVVNAPSKGKIDAGETRDFRFIVEMSNDKIDEWFVSHAAKQERTNGNVNMKMGFEVAEQKLTFPQGGIDCGFSFQTGILVDNQNSSSSFSGCSYRESISGERGSKSSNDNGIIDLDSPSESNNSQSSENSEDDSQNISEDLDSVL